MLRPHTVAAPDVRDTAVDCDGQQQRPQRAVHVKRRLRVVRRKEARGELHGLALPTAAQRRRRREAPRERQREAVDRVDVGVVVCEALRRTGWVGKEVRRCRASAASGSSSSRSRQAAVAAPHLKDANVRHADVGAPEHCRCVRGAGRLDHLEREATRPAASEQMGAGRQGGCVQRWRLWVEFSSCASCATRMRCTDPPPQPLASPVDPPPLPLDSPVIPPPLPLASPVDPPPLPLASPVGLGCAHGGVGVEGLRGAVGRGRELHSGCWDVQSQALGDIIVLKRRVCGRSGACSTARTHAHRQSPTRAARPAGWRRESRRFFGQSGSTGAGVRRRARPPPARPARGI